MSLEDVYQAFCEKQWLSTSSMSTLTSNIEAVAPAASLLHISSNIEAVAEHQQDSQAHAHTRCTLRAGTLGKSRANL